MILQVGFNMRKVTKGNVTIKLWDLGGQPRFRSMWERYCRAVSAIVYAHYYSLCLMFFSDRKFGYCEVLSEAYNICKYGTCSIF